MNELSSTIRNPSVNDDVVEKAKAAGRQVQTAVSDITGASTDALKEHASHALDVAKDVAASAQDQLLSKITEQKGVGADYIHGFAGTMRRAANQFDGDVPVAGDYIRKAADQLENAAGALREGNLNDLVQRAQRFARSQPTAFFGLALLAGFGAVRFLKSASQASAQQPSTDDNMEHREGTSSFDHARRAM